MLWHVVAGLLNQWLVAVAGRSFLYKNRNRYELNQYTKKIRGSHVYKLPTYENTNPVVLLPVKLMTGGAKFGTNGFACCWLLLLLNDSGVKLKLLWLGCMFAELGVRV